MGSILVRELSSGALLDQSSSGGFVEEVWNQQFASSDIFVRRRGRLGSGNDVVRRKSGRAASIVEEQYG